MFTMIQHASAVARFNTIQQVGKDWPKDQYDNFYRLYITEDLPLPEVIKTLKEKHSFIVT